ncbi:hypothetical protein AVEN_61059-1 [Araneus ventricosus]|uniref:Uncharacterized protein n=1 Tax=Araneus ventricosus TaxID=182803 RepID=A0A4Y2DUH6_ARAVE|nr:hypothetical protein AVEN_61059-1 [Araneus ventricosus]
MHYQTTARSKQIRAVISSGVVSQAVRNRRLNFGYALDVLRHVYQTNLGTMKTVSSDAISIDRGGLVVKSRLRIGGFHARNPIDPPYMWA